MFVSMREQDVTCEILTKFPWKIDYSIKKNKTINYGGFHFEYQLMIPFVRTKYESCQKLHKDCPILCGSEV